MDTSVLCFRAFILIYLLYDIIFMEKNQVLYGGDIHG